MDFWSNTKIFPNNNPKLEGDCLVWKGPFDEEGYGITLWNGWERLAHRVAYEYRNGPAPSDMFVRQLCKNKACVAPLHLSLERVLEPILLENVRRKPPKLEEITLKGAKLSPDEVRRMRALHATGKYSQKELARMFNVGSTQVHRIITGESWVGE